MTRFRHWLQQKWQRQDAQALLKAYQVTFSTLEGRQVLQQMIDQTYATICESANPIDLAAHNARRSVVHEILQNLDLAEQPDKYVQKEMTHDDRNGRESSTLSNRDARVTAAGVLDF